MPMAMVDQVGVRNLGWMQANLDGMALYTAMESEVRAVGRIVVWVDADADVRIEIVSSASRMCPMTLSPKSFGPSDRNTLSELSPFDRPMPLSPTPANDTAAVLTMP